MFSGGEKISFYAFSVIGNSVGATLAQKPLLRLPLKVTLPA